jgi:hemin uptake protein HemP
MIQDTNTREPHAKPVPQTTTPIPCVAADDLFRGAAVVMIEFQGEHYQLRRTRAGKLILTK